MLGHVRVRENPAACSSATGESRSRCATLMVPGGSMSVSASVDAAQAAPAVQSVSLPAAATALGDVFDVRTRPGFARRNAPVVTALVAPLPAWVIAVLMDAGPSPFLYLALWTLFAVVRALSRPRTIRPLPGRAQTELRLGSVFCSVVALGAVAGVVPLGSVRGDLAAVLVAAASTALWDALNARDTRPRRVVLVGGRREVEAYAASVSDVDVAGCYVTNGGSSLPTAPSTLPMTTSAEMLVDMVSAVGADTVLVVPGPDLDSVAVRQLAWMLEATPVTVAIASPLSSVSAHRLRIGSLGQDTVVELRAPTATTLAKVAKEVIDRVGAAFILLCAAPLLLLLWLSVRVDSKGPGVFVQQRIGRDQIPFKMYKLRSMYADAEAMKQALIEDNESDGVLFKIRRDPRVTRVGFWLRRSSLDELPQLLNVVRGEMSLVGPRPALPSEVATYDNAALRRLVVKPGITGLWQISGRSDLSWEESLRLDIYYADNWRLVDDLTIAVRTVAAVTQARGAY